MKTRLVLPDFGVPPSLSPDDMPDLLRYWYLGTRARRHMMTRRFREVDAELDAAAGQKVLDVGSAWGYNVMALNRLGYDAVGMDLIDTQFPAGQTVALANGVPLPVVGGDAAGLPFGDETFEFVTMVETLEHVFVEDRPAVLAECFRVLKPGGKLVLSTPNFEGLVERFKRAAGRSTWLRKKLPAMCYPDEGSSRGEYHPYHYHQPIRPRQIRDLLNTAGFDVLSSKRFLFTLKNTPDRLFAAAKSGEKLLEITPGIKNLAATVCFVARKRRQNESHSNKTL